MPEPGGDRLAEHTLTAYLDVFTHHYLQAKNQLPVAWDDTAHRRLRQLSNLPTGSDPAAPGDLDDAT